ncbi:hypothetical protein BDV3_000597 [Batrachochytrium dendrobatidis]
MNLLQQQNSRLDQLFREKLQESHALQQFAARNVLLARTEKESANRPRLRSFIFSDEDQEHAADNTVTLVPIRLDIDLDGAKLRDTFTWNLQDDVVTPELFAKILCEDLALSAAFQPLVVKSIKEQLRDFFQHAPNTLLPLEHDTRGNDDQDVGTKDLPELRTVIKLDITIDNQAMVDQFEWDIGCKRNNPEAFAEHLVNELGLAPEFKTAISHSIREQMHTLSKSLLLIDHKFDLPLPIPSTGSGLIDDDDLATHFLPEIKSQSVLRGLKEHGEFGPYLKVASAADFERIEKELERDSRRKRRQTQRSRRLVTLPDREATRTNRTPLPKASHSASNSVASNLLASNIAAESDTAFNRHTGAPSSASRTGTAFFGSGTYISRRRG